MMEWLSFCQVTMISLMLFLSHTCPNLALRYKFFFLIFFMKIFISINVLGTRSLFSLISPSYFCKFSFSKITPFLLQNYLSFQVLLCLQREKPYQKIVVSENLLENTSFDFINVQDLKITQTNQEIIPNIGIQKKFQEFDTIIIRFNFIDLIKHREKLHIEKLYLFYSLY